MSDKQEKKQKEKVFFLVVYLIPDLLFRAPVPTILIAVLTARTLLIYKKRRVNSTRVNIHRSKSIPFMLTVSVFQHFIS